MCTPRSVVEYKVLTGRDKSKKRGCARPSMVALLLENVTDGSARSEEEGLARNAAGVAYAGGTDTVCSSLPHTAGRKLNFRLFLLARLSPPSSPSSRGCSTSQCRSKRRLRLFLSLDATALLTSACATSCHTSMLLSKRQCTGSLLSLECKVTRRPHGHHSRPSLHQCGRYLWRTLHPRRVDYHEQRLVRNSSVSPSCSC